MNLLVIGGTGYIGSFVVREFSRDERIDKVIVLSRKFAPFLKECGEKVVHIPADIADPSSLQKALSSLSLDVAFHLATASGRDMRELLRVNVGGTLNVMEALKEADLDLFIFASTAANLYGNAVYRPIDEKHPLRPISPYGLSKQMAEAAVSYFVEHYGFPAAIFRQTNVYGWAPVMKYTIVNAFIRDAASKGEVTIVGTGEQQRNFLHMTDLFRYYEAAVFHPNKNKLKGEILNVAGPETVTVKRVAELLKEIMREKYGIDIKITYKAPSGKRAEVYDFPISWEKASQLLGVEPKIHLKQGIEMELDRVLKSSS